VQPPDRLTVAACIGCGSIGHGGTCESGCGVEERFDLVPAEEHDELVAWTEACHARADALRGAVRPLTAEAPADRETAYRELQRAARTALREQPPVALPEPAPVSTTWWCPDCGGLEAPQPCIGICVWRPVQWVAAARYDEARAAAQRAVAQETAWRAVARRAATVTPRAGQWEGGWAALASVVPPDV
jgi:hypothetical protein